MKQFLPLIVLVIFSSLLCSCQSPEQKARRAESDAIRQRVLQSLHKGMTPEDLEKAFNGRDRDFVLKLLDIKITPLYSKFKSGEIDIISRSNGSVTFKQVRAGSSATLTIQSTVTDYEFVFDKNGLTSWRPLKQ